MLNAQPFHSQLAAVAGFTKYGQRRRIAHSASQTRYKAGLGLLSPCSSPHAFIVRRSPRGTERASFELSIARTEYHSSQALICQNPNMPAVVNLLPLAALRLAVHIPAPPPIHHKLPHFNRNTLTRRICTRSRRALDNV